MQSTSTILEIRNLKKTFPGVTANEDVCLAFERGEVHSLLGENGAGKSTLMKIIYGIYSMDSGSIVYNGAPLEVRSPREAIARGIGMIHQHFMLVSAFTVLENIVMGLPGDKGIRLDLQQHREGIRQLVERFNIRLNLDQRVEELSVGMQQKVEIIKALYRKTEFLILDEPTSVLTPQETQDLFMIINELKKEGTTIVFISHKLDEVLQISDRVSVMRDGRLIGTVQNLDIDKSDLSNMMVGRDVSFGQREPGDAPGEVALEVRDLGLSGREGKDLLNGISFSLRKGEIIGVAGVDGNGQEELAETLWGLHTPARGEVFLHGEDITRQSTRDRMNRAMAYIPADRQHQALIGSFTVSENMILTNYYKPRFLKGPVQNTRAVESRARELVEEYRVKTPGLKVMARNLSGGNQQKLILSRAIGDDNEVFIISQPTWGLDVGACEFVYQKIKELKKRGKAILLLSTDLEEVRLLSDRMFVMYDGEMSDTFPVEEKTVQEIGLLMAGVKQKEVS